MLLAVLGNLRSNSTSVLPKLQLIFRWWKISGRDEFYESRPEEIKEYIAIVFGAKVLEHVLKLFQGNYDFLEQLPVWLFLYMISFLELKDIARLSQGSHRFEMFEDKTVDIVSGKPPVKDERTKTTE
ncbi:LOW QUALITY PROTEIN: F-box only protein 36 [Phaethornis superciliosus]